jgi:N-acetylneuraminic acid mutarotase
MGGHVIKTPCMLVSCIFYTLCQAPIAPAAEAGDNPAWKAQAKGCSKRFAHSAVWDSKRENVLLFAGEGRDGKAFVFFNDLWTYSPAKDEWKELTLKDKALPSQRGYHCCVWDSKRNQMWVFGGCGGDFKGLNDLWSFDPETLKWTKLDVPNDGPKGRLSASMQYDPESDSLILVGGLNSFGKGESVRDLWIYDIKASKWTSKKCAAPQLWQCASALDPKRRLLMLHGGFDEKFQVRTETWIYDIAKDEWREPIKGKRFTDAHAGFWDAAQGRMVIFGGANPAKGAKGYDELWSLDPDKAEWKQVEVKGDKPAGRAYHSVTWDPKTRSMIVFGGTVNQFSDPPHENQIWTLRVPDK